jgi:nicotinate-nucleotide adenylyltransferase
MLVGIMGGTFDPIHTGHLIAGERARLGAGLDEVWFMPTNVPPHKNEAPKASAQQRWEMVCRATDSNPFFRAVDIEIEKGGISYTINTLELLQSRYPDNQFAYIIGADMVQYLPYWHRIEDIAARISFIGLKRPGYQLSLDKLPPHIAGRISIVEMPLIEISSTLIRRDRGRGDSIRYLVPETVYEYMEVNRLYGP